MRRNLFIGILCLLLIQSSSIAAPHGAVGGGVNQKMDLDSLKRLELEKRVTKPEKTEAIDESQFEAEVQRDVLMDDGSIYNPQFSLTKVNFEGNTVIKTKDLEALAAELEGKDVYFEDLLDFATQVTKFYQSKGYLTSFALIPEQVIRDGQVTVLITESRIANLNISGERWARDWYLRKIVMGKKGVREGDVFNAVALQNAMKELNERDYISGSTAVHKSQETQLTEIDLDIADRFPLNLDMNWDNYGRSVTGTQRFTAIAGIDNLTGFGDRIYGGTILSSGSTGLLAGYDIPISPYGTRLGYDFMYSRIKLGGDLADLKIKGNSHSHFFKVTHPFIKTAKADLIGTIGFDFSHTESELGLFPGSPKLSDYDLRVLRANLYGMRNDQYGRWIGTLGGDFGFNALGASGTSSGGQKSQFIKLLASAIRVHRLPLDSIGILRINGQYSPDKLYAMEQIQLGGPYTLRGYQPAEIIGDSGVTGTAEIRFPIPFFRALLPQKLEFLEERIRLAAFYDFGWIKDNGNLYGYPKDFLHSVGGGLYVNLTEYLSAQFGLGFPMGSKEYGEKSCRFYFGVNTELDKAIPLRSKQRELEVDNTPEST